MVSAASVNSRKSGPKPFRVLAARLAAARLAPVAEEAVVEAAVQVVAVVRRVVGSLCGGCNLKSVTVGVSMAD